MPLHTKHEKRHDNTTGKTTNENIYSHHTRHLRQQQKSRCKDINAVFDDDNIMV